MSSESDAETPENEIKGHVVNYPPGAAVLRPAGWSVLYTVPDRPNEIVKVPLPLEEYEKAHQIERQVYRRLGEHKNLVRVVKMDEYGIYMEGAEHFCIREYYKKGGTATLSERIKWCRQAAEVLGFVHQHNVRHADMSGRNLLLDSARNILLCDFSGSYIDGDKAQNTLLPLEGHSRSVGEKISPSGCVEGCSCVLQRPANTIGIRKPAAD